jgi:cobalt-zinc-cadmium efflux system membrane fusion protein
MDHAFTDHGVSYMKPAILSFALVAVLAAAGCAKSGSTGGQGPSDPNAASAPGTAYVAPDAKGIQTLTVSMTAIPEYLDLPAHIETDPTRVVHVFAPAGGRIMEMKVRPWDRVKAGEIIAVLESSDLSRAVAAYHKALVDNQVKQKALARSADLLSHLAIAEKDYQQAQGDAEMAQEEVGSAREQVSVFGIDPDHATKELPVTAPRSGVILDDIGAAPGEFSKSLDATGPLCTIADISTIWAVGDIYEKDLSAARQGRQAEVTLNAYPDERWSGRISVISDAVDPATHTLRVRVVLPNPGMRVKPAMFGSIRMLRSESQGILVPSSAVIREANDAYVFVGRGNGRFERRSVKLGRISGGSLEIVSGLNAGDTIVSEGGLLLRTGGHSAGGS